MDREGPPRGRGFSATLLVCVASYAFAAPAVAQVAAPCTDGRVTDIVVENHSVFEPGNRPGGGRLAWLYQLANRLHFRTNADVIERELLFEVGDCYDVDVLRDSERLLRAFDFIADADVYGIRLDDQSVQVIVDTQDEWSTRVEPRFGSGGSASLRGVRVVEENLVGTGRHLGLYYLDEDEQRVYGARYATPHVLGTRLNMDLDFARTEVGYSYGESFTYPFVGETGRIAFRQSAARRERNFEILMPAPENALSRIWVPVRRELLEMGGAVRWGSRRYRHTILGAAVAAERIEYPGEAVFVDQEEPNTRHATAIESRWTPVSSVRLMLLTGQSNIAYVRRRALDTLDGTEDVRIGVEAEASLGPTLPYLSSDRDVAVGIGFFAAGEVADRLLAGGQLAFEGRRGYESLPGLPEWNDVLAELDLWAYLRPSIDSRHLFVGAMSAVGGWHGRVPFQLTLGGDAGLRGYARHVDPGGRRIVGSLEYRTMFGGPVPELVDLGAVAFLDVGRIWAGDVPYGTDSPVRASAGAGIRLAFPPGSRQTFRLDVGMPIESGTSFGDVVVSVGMGQAIGRRASRRDPQIVRSSRYGVRASEFVFP